MLFVPKFRCVLPVVLRLASRMLAMLLPRAAALLSAICPEVSLFFGDSFKLGF